MAFHQGQRAKVANEFSSKLIYFKERASEINLFKLKRMQRHHMQRWTSCLVLGEDVIAAYIQHCFGDSCVITLLFSKL